MNLKVNKSALMLATSATALLATQAFAQDAKPVAGEKVSPDTKGQCHGINACKGQTACATAEGSCAGTNSCKGKGWLLKTKAECDAAKGKFVPFKKS